MAKVLVLFAHPSQARSEVNLPLYQASQLPDVTCVDLYAEYPDFRIDIDREQQRLLQHDVLVFMFPLYWYSTPSLLKEWQDLVLEYGFAYGKGGKALEGKVFFSAITAGGAEVAYQDKGYNHFTIGQLLQPLQQTAYLTKMRYLPPFVLFSSRTAKEDGRLDRHIENWQALLLAFTQEQVDIGASRSLPKLNEWRMSLKGDQQ